MRFKRYWKDRLRMYSMKSFGGGAALAAMSLFAFAAPSAMAQDRNRSRIDVDLYTIEADIPPNTQTLTAKATVRFTPIDDNVTSASFELNNALNVSRVVDAQGKQIPASRN